MAATEWDGATFEAQRPLFFSIAYKNARQRQQSRGRIQQRAPLRRHRSATPTKESDTT